MTSPKASFAGQQLVDREPQHVERILYRETLILPQPAPGIEVENGERKRLPAVDAKAMKKLRARFDRVLVDAPCSGTGSWRRNPDVRWSTQAGNLAELTALQDKILARAAAFVKPGGRLIYATCSLLPAENDERVNEFLRTHGKFERLDAREVWRAVARSPWPCDDSPVLRLSPAKHGTDGFFAAVLQRIPDPR